ncbi:MAG: hypothetical protein Q9183_004933, partial [Haloplaca sp. 2 TL-2023]
METPPSKRQKVTPRTPSLAAQEATAFNTLKVRSADKAYSKASSQRPSSIQFYSVFYSPQGSKRKVPSGGADESAWPEKQQSEVAHSPTIDSESKRKPRTASQHESSKAKADDQPVKAKSSAPNAKGREGTHEILDDDLPASPPGAAARRRPSRTSKGTPTAERERSCALQETVIAESNARDTKILGTPSHHQLDAADDDEPTLPLTPTQRGLEPPPEPPSGLASWTPSK